MFKSAGLLPELPGAACRGMPVELFLGGDGTRQSMPFTERRRVEKARNVCWDCPERQPCREYAIANPMMLGVWGGTTAKEREAMRALRARDEG